MLRGGKTIGSGAHGCTFRPALLVAGQERRRPNTVSKLLQYNNSNTRKHAEDEALANKEAQAAVTRLPEKWKDFFIVGSDTLLVPGQASLEDVENLNCPFFKPSTAPETLQTHISTDLFRILEQRDGGETLDAVVKTLETRDVAYCLKLLSSWCDTSEAVLELNKLGYMHGDLKLDNVVYDDKTLRVIDFEKLTTLQNWISRDKNALQKFSDLSPHMIQNLSAFLFKKNVNNAEISEWIDELEFNESAYRACAGQFDRMKPYFVPDPRFAETSTKETHTYSDFLHFVLFNTKNSFKKFGKDKTLLCKTLLQFNLDGYGMMLMVVEISMKMLAVPSLEPLHELATFICQRFIFYFLNGFYAVEQLPLATELILLRREIENTKKRLAPPPAPKKAAEEEAAREKKEEEVKQESTPAMFFECAPARRRRRVRSRSRRAAAKSRSRRRSRRAVRKSRSRAKRRSKPRAAPQRSRSVRRKRSKPAKKKSRRQR